MIRYARQSQFSMDGAGWFCKSFERTVFAGCPAFFFPSVEATEGVMLIAGSIPSGGGAVKENLRE